jgi:beta-glucosidase
LMMWYSGSEGGHAFADVILGNVDASGRLPFSIPKSEDHLPFLDVEASSIQYDRWFGQRLLDKLGEPARYPLGFGLSYTSFEASDLSVDTALLQENGEKFTVRAKISNVGTRAGRYVGQVYGLTNGVDFPSRVLLGFKPIDLDHEESSVLEISCSARPMQRWKDGTFVLTDRECGIELASSSGYAGALNIQVRL